MCLPVGMEMNMSFFLIVSYGNNIENQAIVERCQGENLDRLHLLNL